MFVLMIFIRLVEMLKTVNMYIFIQLIATGLKGSGYLNVVLCKILRMNLV